MEEKYVFEADWFNSQACLTIKMRLTYYKSDRSIELFNLSTKKLFLKRTILPEIEEHDLRVGSKVTILKREFLIRSYGDVFTQRCLSQE